MPRVLVLATTTGYQTRAFGEAAERLGVDLVYATDRCSVLEDPWRDEAIPIRFQDEVGSAETIIGAARKRRIDGVVAVGDRPTVIAALVNEVLGLEGHPAAAAAAARNKQLTRQRLQAAGLLVPSFVATSTAAEPQALAPSLTFPVVVKPVELSGSRGVMRVDDEAGLVAACYRLRALLHAPEIRAERNDAHGVLLVEQFIPGREFAIEGLLNQGRFDLLALFDKPDPLDGPFFEETIYTTPSSAAPDVQHRIAEAVVQASDAIGLWHGPVHAECRVNEAGVYVLEVAARPIGGLCARALRFTRTQDGGGHTIALEELLLRHALGEASDGWRREDLASGVMMIPIPRRGVFRGVAGLDEARGVAHVDDVRITAKPDQILVPLPEGASYLGFIFARATRPTAVDAALREAHAHLRFAIDSEVRVLQSANG
jgi:hypothetical protein